MKKIRWATIAVLALALALPGASWAAYSEDKEESPNMGLGITALGGVEGYTGSLAPVLDPGPAWGAKVSVQPLPYMGIEASYIGSQSQIDPSLPVEGPFVLRTTGVIDAKFSLPAMVEPYVFGGIGLSRSTVRRNTDLSGLRSDTFGVAPIGGGVDAHYGNLVVGARASYNFFFDDQLTTGTPGSAIEATGGNGWQAGLNIGALF